VGDAGLRAGVEDGVAATNIGPDGMGLANAVADGDPVAVTGAATGEVVFALGEKGGEDTVLHVKHGNVLVEGQLKPFRRGGVKELEDLADVQVVAGSDGAKALGNKEVRGERVGHIEGEVAHHRELEGAEMIKATKVADEDSIRLGVFDEAEEAGFSCFLDPGCGEKDGNLGFLADGLDAGREAAEILEVEVKEVGGFGEESFGLGGVTAKDGKFDHSCRGPFGSDGSEQFGQLRGSSRGRFFLWWA
jgi:hypothetical protein